MNRDDLARFLASVRKKRFIDYLDPIGETAPKALERRLRWAERSQDDPAHTDEARFLLDNVARLRDILRDEMDAEASDWVQGVEAGSEAGAGGWKGAAKSTTDASMIGTPQPVQRKERPEVLDEQVAIMRFEDVTPTPPVARVGGPVKGAEKNRAEQRNAGNTPVGASAGAERPVAEDDTPTPVPPGRVRTPGPPPMRTPPPGERKAAPMPALSVVPQINTPAPIPARARAQNTPESPPPEPAPPPPPAPATVGPSPGRTNMLPVYASIGLVLGLVILFAGAYAWRATYSPVIPSQPPVAPPAEVTPPVVAPPIVAPTPVPETPAEVPPEAPVEKPIEKPPVQPPRPPDTKPPVKPPVKPAEATPAPDVVKPVEPRAPEVVTPAEVPVGVPAKPPEIPAEKPPEAVGSTVAGRYAGKAGDQFLAMTIVGGGDAMTATMQLQTDDGPVDYQFQVSFDSASGAVTLTDATLGARLTGVLEDGKIVGSGNLGTGKPEITWSATR